MHPQVNPYLLYEQMDIATFKPIFSDLLKKEIIFIYEDEQVPVGMFKLVPETHRSSHVVYLGGLAIDPNFSGKGAGTAMLQAIIDYAQQNHFLRIVLSVATYNEKLQYNIKRFKIETTTLHSKFFFIKEGKDNRLEMVSTENEPILMVQSGRGQMIRKAKFKVIKLVEVMGWKAVGAKLTEYSKSVEMEWEKKEHKDDGQPELFE